MKSIWIIASANIKQKKTQTILTIISLSIATLLFATTMGLLKGMNRPFDILFDQLNASHILMYFDHRFQDATAIQKWLKAQEEVERVGPLAAIHTITDPIIFKEKKIDLLLQLVEYQAEDRAQDFLLPLEGEESDQPGLKEIWLPKHFALSNEINVGDSIGIPSQDGLFHLIVSKIIIDPHYSSGMINPNRAWVAAGSLPFFLPTESLHQVMMGIRLENPNQIESLWTRFHQNFFFDGMSFDYHFFKSIFLSFYQVLGAVLLLFSIITLVIALVIISSTLSNSIISDYRVIGMFKALGLENNTLLKVYLLQYFILGAIAMGLGLIGSYFVTQLLLGSLINSIGLANFSFSFSCPFSITLLIVSVMIILVTLWTSRKAVKVDALQAIKFGAQHREFYSFDKMNINPKFLELYLAIKFLFSNPRRLLFMLMSLIAAIFLLVFAINISNSFSNMKTLKPYWGFDNSDLELSRPQNILFPFEHDQFMILLQSEKDIESINPYGYATAIIPASSTKAPKEIFGKVYFQNLAKAGLVNIRGEHPIKENEVSLCILTAKENDKDLRDSINLFVEGTEKRFLITGIYQDISNLGQGFRMKSTAMERINPQFKPNFYGVRINDSTNVDDLKSHLKNKYAESIEIELSIEDRLELMGIMSNLNKTLLLVSAIILMSIFIIIFNSQVNFIRENQKNIGIFKSLGWTPAQLRKSLLIKVLLITSLAFCLGIPLSFLLSPIVISNLTTGLGLAQFPFLFSLGLTLILVPIICLFTLGSAWVSSKKIKSLQVKNLLNTI